MRKSILFIVAANLTLSGCTTFTNFNSKIGTMKNPFATFGDARPKEQRSRVNPFVEANYQVLLGAKDKMGLNAIKKDEMKPYLDAGFALSDYYCEAFFRDADESQRRRRFGRALTNDTGTVISTVLGLANAGQNVVTGVAAGFGFADNAWRNYDEAFVVTPDLANIQALVMAAQDNFREKTVGKDADGKDVKLPENYGKAQTVIMRYANLCSTLGMKALLSQSADEQRTDLQKQTRGETPASPPPPPPQPQVPAGAKGSTAGTPATDAPVAEPRAAPQAVPG